MTRYIHFTEEQKQRANSVELEDFLERRGEQLIRSGREKRLKSDHSITVRGNRWFDHSTEKGGLAIDFVQKFYGLPFQEAVVLLLGGEKGIEFKQTGKSVDEQERNRFVLPEANSDMRRVFAYLIKQRFIDRNVLVYFAREKLLFEDAKYHNAVFVGLDENGVARHAHKRSTATGSGFRINVEGSNPGYSFHYISKNPYPHTLFVFEAPIDLLSYISLHPLNWENSSYVALNGVSGQPILKLLELYPQLQRVSLCLDNDEAGLKAASRIHRTLQQQGFEDVVYDVSVQKDWNEDLIASYSQEQEKPAMMMR
ncbi:hypothetical protein Cpap_0175 [Ruminiclostridium papyrosolvens DSM 2782]|uniref:DUF3991 domain-containing protein n=1 Tax=Ruminiclostridium papyrosolvens DSM 2782 TaxID=588581 RepID=F1TIJ1_9FIRM|nr:DUF3991 and toprim domain-containing protein [Ruminiclostridium papyrosolvens]EGD45808.1 hypothetical protein Cpap_0175 [Ruminiclostridium papyrosolvens DSM 2782]WES33873.1 DUF3991 and toprim domain-containing protein [Ruminiclostridium papyrosolvens DSM 2782]